MHGMRALFYSEHSLHALLMRYARTLQGSLFKGSHIEGSLKGPPIKGSLKAPPIKGSLTGSPIKDSVKGSLRCLLHALLNALLPSYFELSPREQTKAIWTRYETYVCISC